MGRTLKVNTSMELKVRFVRGSIMGLALGLRAKSLLGFVFESCGSWIKSTFGHACIVIADWIVSGGLGILTSLNS